MNYDRHEKKQMVQEMEWLAAQMEKLLRMPGVIDVDAEKALEGVNKQLKGMRESLAENILAAAEMTDRLMKEMKK